MEPRRASFASTASGRTLFAPLRTCGAQGGKTPRHNSNGSAPVVRTGAEAPPALQVRLGACGASAFVARGGACVQGLPSRGASDVDARFPGADRLPLVIDLAASGERKLQLGAPIFVEV